MKDRNKGNRFKNLWFVYTRGGQTAARCSSKLRLSELSENLYICFLSFISIVKCRNIAKWYCGSYSVPYSVTFASRYKKIITLQKRRLQINSCFSIFMMRLVNLGFTLRGSYIEQVKVNPGI